MGGSRRGAEGARAPSKPMAEVVALGLNYMHPARAACCVRLVAAADVAADVSS